MAKPMICRSCGHAGSPRKKTPGSLLIEIVLWCCAIVPGLLYSLWRISKKHYVCEKCGGVELLPLDSPLGAKLQRDLAGGTS